MIVQLSWCQPLGEGFLFSACTSPWSESSHKLRSSPLQSGALVATDVPACLKRGEDAPQLFSNSHCLMLVQQTCLPAGEEARQATPEGPVAKRRRTVSSARPGRRGAEAALSRVGCCRHLQLCW